MCKRKIICMSLSIVLMSSAILIIPSGGLISAFAAESTPLANYGTCIKCHDDLYFLHDTGKWFCIRESPMQCVDCHSGNPYAINEEDAHANRKAHPILNEDVSKCQECHPTECDERVAMFARVAGISDVMVAVPYQSQPSLFPESPPGTQTSEVIRHPGWISVMEVMALVFVTGLAFAIYFFRKVHNA
jgi:hypothetical protein